MKSIDDLSKQKLKAKNIAVFDTHMAQDEKAVPKMEERIGEKLPTLKLMTPGLGIRVDGMKGPITEGELPKCVEFRKKIANQL